MQVQRIKKSTVEARYIQCVLAVRYDEEDIPNDFPFRSGDVWNVTLDIDERRIVDWPAGHSAHVYMKVCDNGSYRLMDANKNLIADRENDYVPGCIPGEYGDYIDFEILNDGTLKDWEPEKDDIEDDFKLLEIDAD